MAPRGQVLSVKDYVMQLVLAVRAAAFRLPASQLDKRVNNKGGPNPAARRLNCHGG